MPGKGQFRGLDYVNLDAGLFKDSSEKRISSLYYRIVVRFWASSDRGLK
jgi:hypothetical protein